jgi:hypothetical protein
MLIVPLLTSLGTFQEIPNRIVYAFELEHTGILPETVQYEIWVSDNSAELYADTVQCQLVRYNLTDHYTCVYVCAYALRYSSTHF